MIVWNEGTPNGGLNSTWKINSNRLPDRSRSQINPLFYTFLYSLSITQVYIYICACGSIRTVLTSLYIRTSNIMTHSHAEWFIASFIGTHWFTKLLMLLLFVVPLLLCEWFRKHDVCVLKINNYTVVTTV